MNNIETKEIDKLPIKRLDLLIPLLAWIILLGLPFFFTGREQQTLSIFNYIRAIVVPLSFMFVFYVNYLFLIDHFLFSHRTWQYFLVNLIVIAFAMAAVHFLFHQVLPPANVGHKPPEREWQEVIGFFTLNILLYLLVAALSVAIKMTGRWYETEKERRELEKNRVEAEIQNLKSQLNPHFLFNTLNNIYSLIAFSPEKAQEAVHDLSKLLRYVLYESSQPMVPLDKEIDFVRNYVELMRIRLPKNVDLKTEINIPNPSVQIAPLLFISLIENAFKHGVSNNKPSFIHININQKDSFIECDICNSSFPKTPDNDKSGSGIGLQNLRKRLALLYPEHYMFHEDKKEDTYSSKLIIDIKE